MPKRPAVKMPISERAKIFMPFAALKGYDEALRAKEKISVPQITLTEDGASQLNQKLQRIQRGDLISVTYYQRHQTNYATNRHSYLKIPDGGNHKQTQKSQEALGEYLQISGKISNIDHVRRQLAVVNQEILFQDILDIKFQQDDF